MINVILIIIGFIGFIMAGCECMSFTHQFLLNGIGIILFGLSTWIFMRRLP